MPEVQNIHFSRNTAESLAPLFFFPTSGAELSGG
jgi:hypothetical protein